MAATPTFDPSLPFTIEGTPSVAPVATPRFNPSQPFQVEQPKMTLVDIMPRPGAPSRNQFISAGQSSDAIPYSAPTVADIGNVFGTMGRMLTGGLADVGETITGQPSRENFDAAIMGQPQPMLQESRLLPMPLRITERAAQGLVESVPKLAAVGAAQTAGIPAPLAAGAVFGTTEQGFDPKGAIVAAALPFVGKYAGEIAGAVAQRFGVDSPTALNWVKGLAGTIAPAAPLIAQQEYEISKLPEDQQHDARIEAWANIAGQMALGPMGVELDHEGAAHEQYVKWLRNDPQMQQAIDAVARDRLNPQNAQLPLNVTPLPLPPEGTAMAPELLQPIQRRLRAAMPVANRSDHNQTKNLFINSESVNNPTENPNGKSREDQNEIIARRREEVSKFVNSLPDGDYIVTLGGEDVPITIERGKKTGRLNIFHTVAGTEFDLFADLNWGRATLPDGTTVWEHSTIRPAGDTTTPDVSSELSTEPPRVTGEPASVASAPPPEAAPSTPQAVAKEIGFEFRGVQPGAAILNDPEAIARATPEEQAMYADIARQQGNQLKFTDTRKGSPTEGLTFYAPENATREEILRRYQEKVQAEKNNLDAVSPKPYKQGMTTAQAAEPAVKSEVPTPQPQALAPLYEPEATVNALFEKKAPIAASVVEDNGLEKQLTEQGYVKRGDQYVYEPAQPSVPAIKSYGQRYIEENGIDAAMSRIEHLRRRMQEQADGKTPAGQWMKPENLAQESDNIARAIITVEPNYDWVTNSIRNPSKQNPNLSIDNSRQQGKLASGEGTNELPPSPVQAQRAASDAAAVANLQQALSRAYGWEHELRPAEVRLGVAGDTSSQINTGELSAVGLIEEALGKRIVGVSSDERLPWNGVTVPAGLGDPNTLYINVKAGIPLHAIIGHELIESMKFTDAKTYSEMFNLLVPLMRNIASYREQLNEVYKREGASPLGLSEAYKEVMADFVGDQFTKPDFWDKLARKNPTLFETVAGYMKNLLSRLINALTPFKSEKFFTDIAKAQDVVVDAINKHRLNQAREGIKATEPRFALQIPKSESAFKRVANAPGVEPENRAVLERNAQVQSGDVQPELRERIITRANTEPSTQAERVAKGLIKPVANLISVHDVPRDFASITDPEQKLMAANTVAQRHISIQNEQAKIDRFNSDAESQMQVAVNAMGRRSSVSLGKDMLETMAQALTKDYANYLDNLQRVASPNENLRAMANALKQKASRQVGNFLVSPGAIEKALQEIADNRAIKTGAEVEPTGTGAERFHPSPSNAEFLNRVRFAGPLKGVNAESQLLLLGGPDGKGLDGVDPLLARIKDLPDKIEALRKINSNAQQATREINDFEAAFNPKAKSVGVGTAMKRYASLVTKAKTADTILKTMDANYAKARERLLGGQEAAGMVDELLNAPGYKQAVQDASKTLGLQFADAFSPVDGEFRTKGPYPEDKHDYIITRTPTKEAAVQNYREASQLLSDIERFQADPQADPAQKQSWQAVHDFVKSQWLENIFAPIEHPEQRDPFDWQHWSLILNPTRTPQSLVRDMIGGKESFDVRKAMDALDYIRGKLQTLELDDKKGIASITLKLVAGAKSHGIDLHSNPMMAEQYRSQILNPIADSLQHYGAVPLKAGDYIPGTATQVTDADIKALQALSDFEQATRKVIETEAQDIFKTGTRIMDEYGGKQFSRVSTPTGPMMLTRYWNDDMGNWINQNWRVGMEGNEREAQIKRLTDAMWNDPEMFRKLVKSYVFETNPDFSKLSAFAKDFRELAAEGKRKPIVVDSLDSLVDALEPKHPELSRDELTKAVKADLEREMVRVMDNVAGEVAADLNPKGNTAIDRAVASSLKTGGAFLDPRGKMLAPESFYTIAKVAKSDVMTNPAMAVTIGRVRVLQGMKELLAAYSKYRDGLENEMRRFEAKTGNPNSRQERIDALDKSVKLGEARYNWSMLNRRITQLQQQVRYAEENMTKFSELFTPSVSRTATTLNRGLTMQLLSSPGAVMQNLLGATYIQDIVLTGLFKGSKSLLESPFGVTKEMARVATDRTIKLIEKTNPGLASALGKLTPFKSELADWLASNAELVQRLTESGQLPPADVLNRIAAKRAVGFGGEVLRHGTEPPLHLQAAQWAFTTPVGLMHEMMFPRAFDNFANTVMGHRATNMLLNIFGRTQDIVDSRLASGGKLDSTNPKQFISPKELGMSGEQMKNIRTLLEPIGTLEQLMFDYGNRMNAARRAGEDVSKVPIMDEAKMGAALLAFGKLGNVLSETNTPAVYRMNRLTRIFGTFGSWPVNFMNQLTRLIPTKLNNSADAMKLAGLAATVAAIAVASIAIKETRREFMEDYTGRLSGEPGLPNVMSDPTSPEAMRYILGALAGGVPYLGTALGQNTDTQSMFDASRVVPLLGLFKDVASMGSNALHTGDISKGLIDFSNRYLPFYSAAINRLPGVNDYIESKNVQQALRAATPANIEKRAYGGGVSNPNPSARYLRQAESAAFSGNATAARGYLNSAIAQRMKSRGISQQEAMNELRQSLGARQPEQRVFGRQLAPSERQTILSRMTNAQLSSYHRGQQAYSTLLSLVPHVATPKGKSLFKGVKFQKPKQRKLRAYTL